MAYDSRYGAHHQKNYDRSNPMMAKGDAGERVVLAYLASRIPQDRIADLRDDPAYRLRDVDFAYEEAPGVSGFVEAKTDYHLGKSGNVIYELNRINLEEDSVQAVTLGWSSRSAADRICWYAPSVHQMWVIFRYELELALKRYGKDAHGKLQIITIRTDPSTLTVSALIPERYFTDDSIKKIDVSKIEAGLGIA